MQFSKERLVRGSPVESLVKSLGDFYGRYFAELLKESPRLSGKY